MLYKLKTFSKVITKRTLTMLSKLSIKIFFSCVGFFYNHINIFMDTKYNYNNNKDGKLC